MNTRTQIAQLPGSIDLIDANSSKSLFVSGMSAEIDPIFQELSINASNQKSHTLIVIGAIKL